MFVLIGGAQLEVVTDLKDAGANLHRDRQLARGGSCSLINDDPVEVSRGQVEVL
ncbi:hypothetical protein D3C84_1090110 [compost metagenome]